MKPTARQFAIMTILYFGESMAGRDLRKALLAKVQTSRLFQFGVLFFHYEMNALERAGWVEVENKPNHNSENQPKEPRYKLTYEGRGLLYSGVNK